MIQWQQQKNIIASTFGWDISEVDDYRYHYGRTEKPIYAIGEQYFCVSKTKPKDDMGGEWKPHSDQFWAEKSCTVLWVCGG